MVGDDLGYNDDGGEIYEYEDDDADERKKMKKKRVEGPLDRMAFPIMVKKSVKPKPKAANLKSDKEQKDILASILQEADDIDVEELDREQNSIASKNEAESIAFTKEEQMMNKYNILPSARGSAP